MSQSPPSRPVLNDRYEIHGRIGRGGMADVYLARDLLLDRPVAVKVLFPEFATDPNFVERFRREAQAAANLTHPNIVGVYDWGQQGTTYFIVMEYVNGRSLAEILRAEGALEPNRSNDIASEVAAALGFAHRSGVVHRDIKPANILVSNQGVVKVADFGIARALNAAAEHGLTQAGAVMGTATYFSPEQAQGSALDPRSDLYSLGVVLYEMLTGQPPFAGDNPVAIAYKQVHDQPIPPSQHRADLPEGLEAVTLKLLAKSPANRFANADELRADLRHVRDGIGSTRTVDAPTMAVSTVGGALATADPTVAVREPATRVVARPAVVTTAATGAVAVSDGYPPYDERRHRVGWFILAILLALGVIAGLVAFLYNRLGTTTTTDLVVVETVINKPFSEAEGILKSQGLTVERVDVDNPTVQAGIVFQQDPAEGAKVDPGTAVKLTVSKGKGTVALGDLRTKTQAEATAALDKLGLKWTIATAQSPDVAQGLVISQDPPPGDVNIEGTTVKLVISAGPGQILIDNVTGLDQAKAAALLGRNFDVDVVFETSDTVAANKVIRTEPGVLTAVDKGSKVRLVVSSGSQPVTVPAVRGLLENEARDKIQHANLLATVVYVTLPFGSPDDGRVISQAPLEGTQIPKGQTVTINVGKALPAPTTTTVEPTTTTVAPTTTTTTRPGP
jgi:beta-lactam-binding protein with PASTA domain/predicted Ser/Thr protein kinase